MVKVHLMITVLTWIERVTAVFWSAEYPLQYHPQHIGAGCVQLRITKLITFTSADTLGV